MLKRFVLVVAALAGIVVSVGCAMQAVSPGPDQSLYQRLGGKDAITTVVNDAIGSISADARINQRFVNAGGTLLTKNLVELICERTGGPCTYAGRNMSAVHDGMHIRDDEFDALVDDLAKSLDKFKVPAREKSEALTILAQMRNAIVGH